VNHKTFEVFFPIEAQRTQIRRPLMLTETSDKFDILATVAGGGVSGQAGAVRLGIARALVKYNAELRKRLKEEGLLTRDARAKERKSLRNGWRAQALPVQQTLKERNGGHLAAIALKDLLEAGGIFGHQTKRWNPKMKRIHLRRAQRHPTFSTSARPLKLFAKPRSSSPILPPKANDSVFRHQTPGRRTSSLKKRSAAGCFRQRAVA
jgi:ribosomal protein S9